MEGSSGFFGECVVEDEDRASIRRSLARFDARFGQLAPRLQHGIELVGELCELILGEP
jgi:hypothetical protein